MLKWIPGSQGLISFGDEPARVPETLLQRIRHRVDEINHVEENIWDGLKPGDQVEIRSGPFAGYEAIFCAHLRGSERAQVLLKVLQEQTIRIDLPLRKLAVTKQNRA
jgi:transcriptional antiterminator RfaH